MGSESAGTSKELAHVQVKHGLVRRLGIGLIAASLAFPLAGGVASAQSEASAEVRDQAGAVVGGVTLTGLGGKVHVQGHFRGLTPGFHGFHVHAVGQCTGNFLSAGGHLNPGGAGHPGHQGDMPVLLVNADGTASTEFTTDRFTLASLFDADGSAIMVHAAPDNYANIPARYSPSVDAMTLATGDAGARAACGVATAGPLMRAIDGQTLADQTAATQQTFRAVWGERAEEEWILQHNAALVGAR